jgi:hypothetical protein
MTSSKVDFFALFLQAMNHELSGQSKIIAHLDACVTATDERLVRNEHRTDRLLGRKKK